MREWFERFKLWVRYEPVRAAEAVRNVLFAVVAMLAAMGVQVEVTSVVGGITALFSIYASKITRDKVSPVAKTEDSEVRTYISEGKAKSYEDAVNGDDEIPV